MEYIKYILCVLMSMNLEALANKKCPDCINVINCDPAKAAVFNNVQKIREAFCGFNDLGTMVCCSYFSNVTESATNNHPNAHLLPNNCSEIDIFNIKPGQFGSLYEFPWMALLEYPSIGTVPYSCVGTIINSRYILTTASCLVSFGNITSVRIGEFNLLSWKDCSEDINGQTICESHIQDMQAEEVIHHEKFEKSPPYNHDIGLIRLTSPIDFSYRNAAPICLPTKTEPNNNNIANKRAIVSAWQLMSAYRPSIPRKTNVHIYTDDECMQVNRSSREERPINQYCVRSLTDSCSIDNGSPLVIYDLSDKYKYVQYGIGSYKLNCEKQIPSMFTSILPYMSWILDHIKE